VSVGRGKTEKRDPITGQVDFLSDTCTRGRAMSDENNPTPSADETLQQRAEAIVADGNDVRGKIARLVSETAGTFQRTGEGLIAVTRAVLAGAGDALNKGASSLPSDGPLRQVIDGLGDGVSQVATSAKLAVEEARSRGQQFASEDLARVKHDLSSLTSLYVHTVTDALKKVRNEASGEVKALAEHAETVRGRVTPAVQSALEAVRTDPVGMGKESLQAGIAVTREAAGSLFTAIGRALQDAGQRLSTQDTPKEPPAPQSNL